MQARLTVNLLWLYGGELLAKVLALLVFAHLGRVFGPATLGDLEFAITVLFVLGLVQEAGLAPYGAREASRRPAATPQLVAQVAAVRGVIAIATLCLLGAFVGFLDRPEAAERLILLYGLALIPTPLLLNWVFQARHQMHVVAAGSVLRQVVLAVGALWCVHGPDDAWRVPLFEAGGLLALVLLQQALFLASGARWDVSNLLREGLRVLREALPLAASSLVWALRINAPLLALWLLRDSDQCGVYGAGARLVISLHTFVWLYFFNLLPSLSRSWADGRFREWDELLNASMRLVSWAVPYGCLFLGLIAPWLLPALYSAQFTESGPVFQLQVWMVTAAFLSGHHRYGLIASGHQSKELRANTTGALVSLGACLALAPWLDPRLAAIILVTSEVITLIVADLLLRRVRPLRTWSLVLRPALVFSGAGLIAVGFGPKHAVLGGSLAAAVAVIAGLCMEGSHWKQALLRLRGRPSPGERTAVDEG